MKEAGRELPPGLIRSCSPAACTIISRNYLAYAKVLAKSYFKHIPNGRFYVLVVDELPENEVLDVAMEVVKPSDLGLDHFYEMSFKYNVTELSTAVKPSFLRHLIDARGEDRVIYFDPDILILNDLRALIYIMGGTDILLTPHILSPIPLDGRRPAEQDILIAGAYNLGFLALRRSPAVAALLAWWEERLRDHCRIDPAKGLMTDQKWIDLVPSLFPTASILRDPTYNVAYWNLHERTIGQGGAGFLVNGRPLSFYHFSGFDPKKPNDLSKHQNRTELVEGTAIHDLFRHYSALLEENGHDGYRALGYGYERFGNGCTVHPLLRELYLGLGPEDRSRFGNPFHVNGQGCFLDWATRPRDDRGGLSLFTESIHRVRFDVAASFPDARGRDREAFLRWACTQGAREMGYEPLLVRAGGEAKPDRNGSAVSLQSETPAAVVGEPSENPAPVNGAVVSAVAAAVVPAITTTLTSSLATTPGVNLVGYLRNESGLGSAARGYLSALQVLGTATSLKDLSALSVNRSEDATLSRFDDVHPHEVNLFCINADQHFVTMSHLGEEFFRGRYNIGIWAWELPRFPAKWHDRFPYYDEIWVGTSFIASTLATVSPIPIVRIPPVMTVDNPGDARRGRARLGIAPDEFVFLFMFDFHSFFERKNPLAVIEAFRRAFAPTDRVRLFIKCVNPSFDREAAARMEQRASGYPVTIIPEYWSGPQVRDLMAACDAYVSLHRSEGTGLTMSEAMAIGKPVIATGWSGNVDFMNVSNSYPVRYNLIELEHNVGPYQRGETWADPSVEHAAYCMRRVFEDREEARAIGRAAQREIETNYSARAIAGAIRPRLSVIADRSRFREHRRGLETGQLPPKHVEYHRQVDRIRATVRHALPPDASVIVISKGDDELLKLEGRQGHHFPQTADGTYAGYYPADSAVAIAHLESLRARGANYLIIPQTAAWWLEYYAEFARHLESRYRRVLHDETCTIFHLMPSGPPDESGRIDVLFMQLDALRDQVERPARNADGGGELAERLGALERSVADRLATLEARLREQEERHDRRAAEVEERCRAMAARVEALEARLATMLDVQSRRVDEVADRLEEQERPLADLAEETRRIRERLSARPSIAGDAFGLAGHPDRPMGYSVDAADLGVGGTTAGRPHLQDLYRGRSRRSPGRDRAYLPFLEGLTDIVELGCGRGEFLALLRDAGISGIGVEADRAMVAKARSRGLDVLEADALDFLRGLPAGSCDAIFSAGLLEHLEPARVPELLELARVRLRPRGLFIAETSNPECFEEWRTFAVDPTRQRPIFPQTLLFLCQRAGFPSARIFYPADGGFTQRPYDTAAEYAVIAIA